MTVLGHESTGPYVDMEESDGGDWVLYDEHRSQIDRLETELENHKAWRAEANELRENQ